MIALGETKIGKIYLGENEIKRVYKGTNLVFDSKPYDAQIEYLKGDGNAYITLPFVGYSDQTTFELEFINTLPTESTSLIGSRKGTNERFCWSLNPNGTSVQIGYGNYYENVNNTITNGDRVVIETNISEQKITYTITNKTTNTVATSTNISINSFNVLDYIYLFWSGALGKSSSSIIRCKIKNGETLVRDLIPVRVGNEGYMYDKVSGKLFGNSGEGEFILGEDIVEIEYLESTGTQYIDTLVNTDSNLSLEIKMANVNTNWNNAAVTGTRLNTSRMYHINFASEGVRLYYYSSSRTFNYKPSNNVPFVVKVDTQNNIAYCDNNSTTITNTSFNLQTNFWLFQRNPTISSGVKIKIYYCKFWDGNTLVGDFIPVRIGNVGYMYDKVSGQLFRNNDGDNFILGNDVN